MITGQTHTAWAMRWHIAVGCSIPVRSTIHAKSDLRRAYTFTILWVVFFCLRIRNHGLKSSPRTKTGGSLTYPTKLVISGTSDERTWMGCLRSSFALLGDSQMWMRIEMRKKEICMLTKHSQTRWGGHLNQYHFQNIWQSQDYSQPSSLELIYEQRQGRSAYWDENNIGWVEAGAINLKLVISIQILVFYWLTSWTIWSSKDSKVWTPLRCTRHKKPPSFLETIVIASSFNAATCRTGTLW